MSLAEIPENFAINETASNDHLQVAVNPEKGILLCTCLKSYIPADIFKDTFEAIEHSLNGSPVKKMIFDKSNLSVFDQDSMQWYHVEWKPKMYKRGLKHHRKILPNDDFFRTSVQAGRKKIKNAYPEFNFEDYDIQYCQSVEEAIEK
jgi:hypothetical protein